MDVKMEFCFWQNSIFEYEIVPQGHHNMPLGILHIASAIFHISARKYFTFPPGKISLGIAKIPFRNAYWGGAFSAFRIP
jgi:hypothetical protein